MAHVPIMLNTEDKSILIIGGGQVAERKAEILLRCGARIHLISEEFTENILKLPVETTRLRIDDISKIKDQIRNCAFVIIATDNTSLNSQLESHCRDTGVLYNRIDERRSPVIFPAVANSNGVTVSVSTSGRSPGFARFLRDTISLDLDKYTAALPVLEKIRLNCHIRDFHKRSGFFQKLLHDQEFWNRVDSGKMESAYEYGMAMLSSIVDS